IPSLGLIGFAANLAWARYATVQQMGRVQGLAALNEHVSVTIHELQRERGRTSLFVGARGTRYRAELADQRAASDGAVRDLNAFISTFDTASDAALGAPLQQVQQDFGTLNTHRGQVDQLALPA